MAMFWSPTTRGFYLPGHAGTPADVIEISDEAHIALLEGQASGQAIELADGVPALVAHPLLPPEVVARASRDRLLVDTDGIIQRHQDEVLAGRAPTLTPAQLSAWLSYRQALRDLPLQPGFPETVVWPEAPA